ncbi:MAG: hypothetical protein JSS76_07555 [Bacteroidetes bacterium]|nr:hypothetical protein [Bacteroidota bacterium]MBS1684591.1 hypothetical protein [Bacteroidota bacterium]
MKKLFILCCVAGLATFSSCKKDYTCTCTQNGAPAQVIVIPGASQSQAAVICKGDAQYISGGTPRSCTLN